MRRVIAILGAFVLTAALAGSTFAATPKNSFVGDFDLVSPSDGAIFGHVTAQLYLPTAQRLVPGFYDFTGAAGNSIRESHSQIGHVSFWFDPNNPAPGLGGSNVFMAEGVECVYLEPWNADCHPWAVMFIDDLDPALPDQVAFAITRDPTSGDWDFAYWFNVGKGDFVLKGDFPQG